MAKRALTNVGQVWPVVRSHGHRRRGAMPGETRTNALGLVIYPNRGEVWSISLAPATAGGELTHHSFSRQLSIVTGNVACQGLWSCKKVTFMFQGPAIVAIPTN